MRIIKKALQFPMDYTLDNSKENQTYINNPNVNWDCYCACYGLNQMIEKLQVLLIVLYGN